MGFISGSGEPPSPDRLALSQVLSWAWWAFGTRGMWAEETGIWCLGWRPESAAAGVGLCRPQSCGHLLGGWPCPPPSPSTSGPISCLCSSGCWPALGPRACRCCGGQEGRGVASARAPILSWPKGGCCASGAPFPSAHSHRFPRAGGHDQPLPGASPEGRLVGVAPLSGVQIGSRGLSQP